MIKANSKQLKSSKKYNINSQKYVALKNTD